MIGIELTVLKLKLFDFKLASISHQKSKSSQSQVLLIAKFQCT